VATGGEPREVIEARVRRALAAAQKYSLVASSVKSEIVVEPDIAVVSEAHGAAGGESNDGGER
jgi:hypothetical protein